MGWIFWVGLVIVLFVIASQLFWKFYLQPRYNNIKGIMQMADSIKTLNLQDVFKGMNDPDADPNAYMPVLPKSPDEEDDKKKDKKKPESPADFKLKTDCDV
jgi:uncharacterized membrane protein